MREECAAHAWPAGCSEESRCTDSMSLAAHICSDLEELDRSRHCSRITVPVDMMIGSVSCAAMPILGATMHENFVSSVQEHLEDATASITPRCARAHAHVSKEVARTW